jgi:hypothetical protein
VFNRKVSVFLHATFHTQTVVPHLKNNLGNKKKNKKELKYAKRNRTFEECKKV